MIDFNIVLAGLADAFTLYNMLFVLFGVILGQLVGALPGTGPVMAMAIAIPFTFTLNPLTAIAFLVGVNKGGLVGGAIPAILINTPGTPDAAATTLDGFPMTQKGKPEKATKMALYSSISGDAFSDIVLFTVSPLIAAVALKLGPMEIFALMVFAFSVIAGLVGDSMAKGIASAALGLFCATVGLDPENSSPRFIFGFFELYEGLPLVAVALGMLAVPEIFRRLSQIRGVISSAVKVPKTQKKEDRRVSWAEYWACRYTILRGSVIGTIMGAIPGLDSSAAAFMTYATTKQTSKDHGIGQQFGLRSQFDPDVDPGHTRQYCSGIDYHRLDDSRRPAGPSSFQGTGTVDLRSFRCFDDGQCVKSPIGTFRAAYLVTRHSIAGIVYFSSGTAALHGGRIYGHGRVAGSGDYVHLRLHQLFHECLRLLGHCLCDRIFSRRTI